MAKYYVTYSISRNAQWTIFSTQEKYIHQIYWSLDNYLEQDIQLKFTGHV